MQTLCDQVDLPVIQSCAAFLHKKLCMDFHEIFLTKGLKLILFWRWSRLTFTVVQRSQSPARSFRYKIDSSAEMVRDFGRNNYRTQKVVFVLSNGTILDDLGGRFKVKPRDDMFPLWILFPIKCMFEAAAANNGLSNVSSSMKNCAVRFLRRWRFALWVLALYSHRLRSVNGNRPSQWEMANFDPPPYRIETPELIATKFGITDYVLEGSLTQIWYKSIRWALLSIWVKYNVFVLFVHIFFWDSAYRSDPLMNFYAW